LASTRYGAQGDSHLHVRIGRFGFAQRKSERSFCDLLWFFERQIIDSQPMHLEILREWWGNPESMTPEYRYGRKRITELEDRA
jgi:hypothetical protein